MYQTVKQTDEEKLAMYMKLSKRQIAIMLVSCNNNLDMFISKQTPIGFPIIQQQFDPLIPPFTVTSTL